MDCKTFGKLTEAAPYTSWLYADTVSGPGVGYQQLAVPTWYELLCEQHTQIKTLPKLIELYGLW